jgi:hypothetical protein
MPGNPRPATLSKAHTNKTKSSPHPSPTQPRIKTSSTGLAVHHLPQHLNSEINECQFFLNPQFNACWSKLSP